MYVLRSLIYHTYLLPDLLGIDSVGIRHPQLGLVVPNDVGMS